MFMRRQYCKFPVRSALNYPLEQTTVARTQHITPRSRNPGQSRGQISYNRSMLRTLLLTTLSIGSLGITGCHLYFEDETLSEDPDEMWPDDCSELGCDGERPDGERPDGERPDGERPDEPPPVPCESDDECLAGCYCSDAGFCEESSLCRLNQDCGDGFLCDAGTCVPADASEPPATCDGHSNDEASCLSEESCSPVYRGVNCTSEDGEPCTSNSASCSCESFSFDSCEDA